MEPRLSESIPKCQSSQQECQICRNCYSSLRQPKLLDCQHSCCWVCLTRIRRSQGLRCPWCRCVTPLPPGASVSQLPDDPNTMASLPVPFTPEYTAVFIRLHSSTFYLPVDNEERPTRLEEHLARHLLAGQLREMSLVPVWDGRSPGLGEEPEREKGGCKSLCMTRACLMFLLGFVILLIMYIVLQNIKGQMKS